MSLIKKSAIALAVASALGFSVAASAAGYTPPCDGWWTFDVAAGPSWASHNNAAAGLTTAGEVTFRTGYAVQGRVGYLSSKTGFGFGSYGGYRETRVRRHDGTLITGVDGPQFAIAEGGVFGSYHAYNWTNWNLTPYVSAGFGVAHIEYSRGASTFNLPPTTDGRISTRMTGQVAVGADYAFSDAFSAGIEYQYWTTFSAPKRLDHRLDTHTLFFTLGYRLPACV